MTSVPHSTGVNVYVICWCCTTNVCPSNGNCIGRKHIQFHQSTTPTLEISKLESLVILNVAPDPDPSFVEGTLVYVVSIPTLDPVVLVTGNVKII